MKSSSSVAMTCIPSTRTSWRISETFSGVTSRLRESASNISLPRQHWIVNPYPWICKSILWNHSGTLCCLENMSSGWHRCIACASRKTRSILYSHSAITSRFILLYVSTQIVTNEDELFWAVDVNMGIPQWRTSQENMCNQSIMYGTASNTSLQQFDSLNLALGAFCTISVSDFYIEAKTFRGMSVETGHVSLYDTPTTSCPSWIWPNHKRPVSPQAKWKSTHDLTLDPTCWPQCRGRNGLCRCQCIIDLPHEDTKLSTRISWIPPKETQPHWRSEQMVTREEA